MAYVPSRNRLLIGTWRQGIHWTLLNGTYMGTFMAIKYTRAIEVDDQNQLVFILSQKRLYKASTNGTMLSKFRSKFGWDMVLIFKHEVLVVTTRKRESLLVVSYDGHVVQTLVNIKRQRLNTIQGGLINGVTATRDGGKIYYFVKGHNKCILKQTSLNKTLNSKTIWRDTSGPLIKIEYYSGDIFITYVKKQELKIISLKDLSVRVVQLQLQLTTKGGVFCIIED